MHEKVNLTEKERCIIHIDVQDISVDNCAFHMPALLTMLRAVPCSSMVCLLTAVSPWWLQVHLAGCGHLHLPQQLRTKLVHSCFNHKYYSGNFLKQQSTAILILTQCRIFQKENYFAVILYHQFSVELQSKWHITRRQFIIHMTSKCLHGSWNCFTKLIKSSAPRCSENWELGHLFQHCQFHRQ